MHLQIIVGSIRAGRVALPVAAWVEQVAVAHGPWTTELVDLKTWGLPMFDLAKPPAMGAYEDELQRRWAKTISRGDAYTLAELDALTGQLEWSFDAVAMMSAFSLILDVNGEDFLHYAFI